MQDQIAYFGYGSLVNLATLRTPFVAHYAASLKGWRRCWLARPKVPGSFAPIDNLAFLSAYPDPATTIDGLMIVDSATSLPQLDERERLYERLPLERGNLHFSSADQPASPMPLYIYSADRTQHVADRPRILRSYLDAVFQGFYRNFGVDGLERFIETTDGFDLPILEDREEPLYPRAVELSGVERRLFDNLL